MLSRALICTRQTPWPPYSTCRDAGPATAPGRCRERPHTRRAVVRADPTASWQCPRRSRRSSTQSTATPPGAETAHRNKGPTCLPPITVLAGESVVLRGRAGVWHQRCRRHEHPPQHLADVWQVMAGMPVPGQPPQVRGHDRIRYANQPIVPPDHRARSRGGLELGRVPRLAPLHRAAVDYDRSTVRSASEEVRCMRDQFAASSRQDSQTVARRCRPLLEIQRITVLSTTRS